MKTYDGVLGSGKNKCECADPGCDAHTSKEDCREYASTILYRIDMEDNSGTAFCEACAADAIGSGVFTDELDDDIDDDAEAVGA